MNEYKSDEEKAEDLKAWWREYGNTVIAAVVLAIAGLFGWEYWQKSQANQIETASRLYHELQSTRDTTSIADLSATLQKNHKRSPYAALASMQHAKQLAENGDNKAAADALNWAITNTKDPQLKAIAYLRLARILVALEQLDEAAKNLDAVTEAAYLPLKLEIQGDIYAARNQAVEARSAYEKAIANNQNGSNELIQLKIDNLGQGV